MSSFYPIYCMLWVVMLKEVNTIVDEPYMDEPFHFAQAQAYCRGDFTTWDPKITTPPGLYLLSYALKRLVFFKCNLPILRLTPLLSLLALPLVLTRLLCYHKRERPPTSILSPLPEAMVLSTFPIAWFFAFLYYTETPSVLLVVWTVVEASTGNHWLAALLGSLSCTFRQTNIVWVLYAYASSQLTFLRFRRASPGQPEPKKLHDPPSFSAVPSDIFYALKSIPHVLPDILAAFVPYSLVLISFGVFVTWNGGIVLGDKANHIPSFHVPQLYYFVAFATFFGWPILISGPDGGLKLLAGVKSSMFGGRLRTFITFIVCGIMSVTVKLFTIQHPFLLSDNRHYTFYVWRRIYLLHPVIPYALTPIYVGCAWAWFLRIGRDQTLLQTVLLPLLVVPTLLPTPLIEPRYFLIPYILLRSQVGNIGKWGVIGEGAWYGVVNGITMGMFLYAPRSGVGRFMW